MAVATHVSRVAKDYAPYGYSIMADVALKSGTLSSTGIFVPLRADDADILIDSIKFAPGTSYGNTSGHASNYWKIHFLEWTPSLGAPVATGSPNPTSTTAIATMRATDVAGGSLTAWTPESATLASTPVLDKGKVLCVFLEKEGSAANLNLTVWVRHRRKA